MQMNHHCKICGNGLTIVMSRTDISMSDQLATSTIEAPAYQYLQHNSMGYLVDEAYCPVCGVKYHKDVITGS